MGCRAAVSAVVVGLCLVSAAPAQRGREETGASYGWKSDYQAAKAEAKKTGKPLMVVFRCVP